MLVTTRWSRYGSVSTSVVVGVARDPQPLPPRDRVVVEEPLEPLEDPGQRHLRDRRARSRRGSAAMRARCSLSSWTMLAGHVPGVGRRDRDLLGAGAVHRVAGADDAQEHVGEVVEEGPLERRPPPLDRDVCQRQQDEPLGGDVQRLGAHAELGVDQLAIPVHGERAVALHRPALVQRGQDGDGRAARPAGGGGAAAAGEVLLRMDAADRLARGAGRGRRRARSTPSERQVAGVERHHLPPPVEDRDRARPGLQDRVDQRARRREGDLRREPVAGRPRARAGGTRCLRLGEGVQLLLQRAGSARQGPVVRHRGYPRDPPPRRRERTPPILWRIAARSAR